MLFLFLSLATLLLAGCSASRELKTGSSHQLLPEGNASPPDELAALLPGLMAETGIPGLSIAVIEGGELAWSTGFGVTNTEAGEPVTADTVFEAASLSKPVLAYLALRMVERGELDLDGSIHEILAYERFEDDERARALTPRLVLSHQTGLPNWGDTPLSFDRDPGTAFGYSGEGYVYLQRAIEAQTGSTLEALAQLEVFAPFGMSNSRFTWPEGERPTHLATGHDAVGKPVARGRPEANAASSLHTTARDYARFVIAWLSAEALAPATVRAALQPEVRMQGDERGSLAKDVKDTVGWGLGWGIQKQPGEETIAWHWGDNGVFRAFVAFRPADRSGVVYFANSINGLSIAEQVVEPVVGDMSPTIHWLRYEQATDPTWQPRRQGLVAEGAGDYEAAVVHYRQVLALDPDDENLARRIAWLDDLQRVAKNPVSIPLEDLQRYTGRYGPRTLFLEGNELHYQREGRPAYSLTPLSPDTFALDGMVHFRLQIVLDDEGKPTKLVGHYVEGGHDESPRDEEAGTDRK